MTCNCTLHPRKPHRDPCRACAPKHVQLTRSEQNVIENRSARSEGLNLETASPSHGRPSVHLSHDVGRGQGAPDVRAAIVSLPSGERALQTGSPVGSPRPPLTAGRRPT